VIAQHGRFVAQESLVPPSAALRDSTIVRGVEHLSGLTGGALLLGAHVGPPRTWVALRAHGYPVRFAGRMEYTSDSEEWRRLVEEQIVIPMRGGDGASRVQALYAIRRLLASGALVFMTSDGPFGREAFRIELPGGSQIIRSGWLTLRRQLRVPTLPVFAHLRGRERVIEIHPPLPAIDDDEARDVEACRRALTPIIGAYVRAHPEQCRYLAFPPW
jgi:lauroyl/myristoyl acyltransferase